MEFDRARLMNNINVLLKEKGLKVGEVENAVGISVGYLSKMTKSDKESMPGVDLIYKLAQKLEVSVEALINGDFNKSNDNLLFLIKFLHCLKQDTDLHEIEWEFFRNYSEIKEKYGMDDLPMFTRTCEVSMKNGTSAFKFNSQFSLDANLTVTTENFCGFASIGMILLFKLTNHLPDGEKTEFEMYAIEDKGGGQEEFVPICSSLDSDGDVSPYMLDLYNCLVRHSKDLKVSDETRSLINRYLNSRQPEELPFN